MRYDLVKQLAIGGMSELFLAHAHEGSDYRGTVVIKTVKRGTDHGPAAALLRNEARLGSVLQHENIVRLIDAELEGEAPYLVLEFIFGRDLGQLLDRCLARGTPIPGAHVRTILADLLDALDYSYFEARVDGVPARAVHLDVSPQNVLIGFDGRTRLLDFGLSQWAHLAEPAQLGARGGKLAYSAPEVVRGLAVDHRTDLFGVGVVSWELWAHRRLHGHQEPRDLAERVMRGGAPWPRNRLRPVPTRLAWWTWWALRRWPDLRPARAREWARALRPDRKDVRVQSRAALAGWMAQLYRGPLARRARALAAEPDELERRLIHDGGFELLPRGDVTEDLDVSGIDGLGSHGGSHR